MKTFKLPDLGEGLPDAEIVEWFVAEGDEVKVDQPLVSMETAKAVVEVPSPYAGKIAKLYGAAGDVIDTGAALVDFDTGEGTGEPAAVSEESQPVTDADVEGTRSDPPADEEARQDSGTVVGQMESSDDVVSERQSSVGKGFATPAVRALARKLGVDLAHVTPTGKNGVITAKDVKQAAESGTAKAGAKPAQQSIAKAPAPAPAKPSPPLPKGEWTAVRGPRRAMARAMAQAHAQVVATTITEDADITAWSNSEDLTVRMLQALAGASAAEPSLNAWFNGEKSEMLNHARVDVGLAVDTEDGLFVPAVRDVGNKSADDLRSDINTIRDQVKARSIPPEAMRDYTIMLSNVGVYAGKYTTPVITPPCVCIVAVGRARNIAVPVLGGFEARKVLPLSVTFDHRAVTGGEAARFLRALMQSLA